MILPKREDIRGADRANRLDDGAVQKQSQLSPVTLARSAQLEWRFAKDDGIGEGDREPRRRVL